ncbi:uncharacterized protein C8A04DRAFT_15016 [Dichotomopilus funicola]|uniref:Uncharacterized protein n=1 Tax=Dichotomopilus funicola TaxID=1934379 RepID=A0AAN6UXL4_9PEZI|nr:hypothetical protein C8A04DRAFT_15016 [Dichotomopilus funicola]
MQRKQGRGPSGLQSRLKPVELDPLAEYGLPSKGEKRLLVHKIQESYYALIASRYLAFCTAAGDRDNLQKQFAGLSLSNNLSSSSSASQQLSVDQLPSLPSLTATAQTALAGASASSAEEKQRDTLPQLLFALRKLREGLVSADRRDHFAAQVFLFSVRLGVLTGAYETYLPAGLHLLRCGGGGGNTDSPTPAASLTSVEHHEVVSYLVLDAACRRSDLSAAPLRGDDKHVDAALAALVSDDWVAWRRVRRQVDGYRARLMGFAEARMVGHTLKAFARAYLTVPLAVLEEQTGCEWEELRGTYGVGWEREGEKVVIRRVQGR